jgi:DNA-binding protein HU-beta
MKKADLVTKLVQRVDAKGFTVDVASKVINEVFNIITEALEDGDSYSQDKFGTFKVVHRAPRKGRNPQTGEEVVIPEKTAPKWVVSRQLKDKISK